jgi:hypothetical protein
LGSFLRFRFSLFEKPLGGSKKTSVLTKEKKLAWQSSRLAPFVWLFVPVMLKTCPNTGLVEVDRDPQRVAEGVLGAQISGAWAAIMAE